MRRSTLLIGVAAAVALVYVLKRKKATASTAIPGQPRLIANRLDAGTSIISNTGGASQCMVLPDAGAAQRDTERWGYGSGS